MSEAGLEKIGMDVLGFQILPFVPLHEILSEFFFPYNVTQRQGDDAIQGQGNDVT